MRRGVVVVHQAAAAMTMIITLCTTVIVDAGTPAASCRLMPPETRNPNNCDTAATAVIEPRASRPTTSPLNPKPEEKPSARMKGAVVTSSPPARPENPPAAVSPRNAVRSTGTPSRAAAVPDSPTDRSRRPTALWRSMIPTAMTSSTASTTAIVAGLRCSPSSGRCADGCSASDCGSVSDDVIGWRSSEGS